MQEHEALTNELTILQERSNQTQELIRQVDVSKLIFYYYNIIIIIVVIIMYFIVILLYFLIVNF